MNNLQSKISDVNINSDAPCAIFVKNDRPVTIATGKSRKDTNWKNKEILWSKLIKDLSSTTTTNETHEEFMKLSKEEQADIKDVGGFVGGSLKNGSRKITDVAWRQLVTLDADYATADFWNRVISNLNYCCLIYSTHKHCPTSPRYRLVIPLERAVNAEEYQAVSRKIAEVIGIEFFDDSTHQPNRMMYYPSTSSDIEFVFEYQGGDWLNPDYILSSYDNWQDTSCWAASTSINKKIERLSIELGKPEDKPGLIGAFCKAYNIEDAISEFLTEVYTKSSDPVRYTYLKGTTEKGLVIYEDGDFAYSFHGTDPVSEILCNSFDLVRLHKFGHLDRNKRGDVVSDKLPSQKKMLEFVSQDPNVKKIMISDRINANSEESWYTKLDVDTKGNIKNTLSNFILILSEDSVLKGIYYDEFRQNINIDADGNQPWKSLKNGWNATDQPSLAGYIDKSYGIYSKEKMRDAVMTVALERSRHPVKEYLNNLPEWDGEERLDSLLIDYLGADDNEYVRAVARKTLVASISRIMHPGIKFDTVLVINGPQGIGKSTLFSKMGGSFYSDSLSISDMKDKTAAEKLQGYWIVEMGELAGMKRVDEETLKSFLSRQDDKYRASYGYSVEDHPRQCIIVGTTNQVTGFLRDLTGGRRFWAVRVSGNSEDKPWDLNKNDIEQIWAEAFKRYIDDESLVLSGLAEELAKEAQIEAFESDEREGLVRDFLEMNLPKEWEDMNVSVRRLHLREYGCKTLDGSTKKREHISVMEIWCELFDKEKNVIQKRDSYGINAILRKIDGWEGYQGNKNGTMNLPHYGKQRVYVRKKQEQEEQE